MWMTERVITCSRGQQVGRRGMTMRSSRCSAGDEMPGMQGPVLGHDGPEEMGAQKPSRRSPGASMAGRAVSTRPLLPYLLFLWQKLGVDEKGQMPACYGVSPWPGPCAGLSQQKPREAGGLSPIVRETEVASEGPSTCPGSWTWHAEQQDSMHVQLLPGQTAAPTAGPRSRSQSGDEGVRAAPVTGPLPGENRTQHPALLRRLRPTHGRSPRSHGCAPRPAALT